MPIVNTNPDTADFKACAEKSEAATLVPVTMFIAIDKSGSMADNGKWDALKKAFTTFFSEPSAASLNVALRFWPLDGCDGKSCSVAQCAQPSVPVGPLSDKMHRDALINGLTSTMPQGDTPMSAALAGAEDWARARKQGNPTEKVVVVLVTDGEATACDKNPATIAALAGDSRKAYGTLTYAIGFPGSAQSDMDGIAKAGGTDAGFFLSGANVELDFLAALLKISGQSVACNFPVPKGDKPIETGLVSIVYTPGGGVAGKLKRIDGPMACAGGGFYYDNPKTPTTITLCDSTCATVKADSKAALNIKIGCKCMTNADCPAGNVCTAIGCVAPCNGADCPASDTTGGVGDGSLVVAPDEAVQGGAFSCHIADENDRSAWVWIALSVIMLRRRPRGGNIARR